MGFIINPYQFGVAFTGLLDTYSGAAAAYSAARRLSSTYTGSLIRVRRSSDNTEQDIGYDSNNVLDESALTTFVGANNGFVVKWYDQSGNGKDASQTTAGIQPKIVSSGTIEKINSKPSLKFGGSGGFILDFSSGTYSAASAFTVFNKSQNITEYGVISGYAGASPANVHHPYSDGVTYDSFFMTSRLTLGGSMNVAGNYILQQINSGSELTDYYNNTATNTVSGTFAKSSSYRIGDNNDLFYIFNDRMSEHILWLSNKSSDRTGINTNINTFYSIY